GAPGVRPRVSVAAVTAKVWTIAPEGSVAVTGMKGLIGVPPVSTVLLLLVPTIAGLSRAAQVTHTREPPEDHAPGGSLTPPPRLAAPPHAAGRRREDHRRPPRTAAPTAR